MVAQPSIQSSGFIDVSKVIDSVRFGQYRGFAYEKDDSAAIEQLQNDLAKRVNDQFEIFQNEVPDAISMDVQMLMNNEKEEMDEEQYKQYDEKLKQEILKMFEPEEPEEENLLGAGGDQGQEKLE